MSLRKNIIASYTSQIYVTLIGILILGSVSEIVLVSIGWAFVIFGTILSCLDSPKSKRS